MWRSLVALAATLVLACGPSVPAPTATPARTTTPPLVLPSPTPTAADATPQPTPEPAPGHTPGPLVPARVVEVIDGDTIRVELDGQVVRVRYIGIDTPELDDERPEVRALAEEAAEINRRMVLGRVVLLARDVSETDRFGRLLRYVYIQGFGGEVFVNAELVGLGYATALTIPPDVRFAELFGQLEAEAREAGRGLWALPSPSPTSSP